MWTSETDANYSGQSVARRMRFYYKQEFICELEVGTAAQQTRALEFWAYLKISPHRILKVLKILEDYIGCTFDDLQIADDGRTLLVRGQAAGIV